MKKLLTPEEFYELTFNRDYSIVKNLKNNPLYSFNTMMMFIELYKNYLIEFNNSK